VAVLATETVVETVNRDKQGGGCCTVVVELSTNDDDAGERRGTALKTSLQTPFYYPPYRHTLNPQQ